MSKPFWMTRESKCPFCGERLLHRAPPIEFICHKCEKVYRFKDYIYTALMSSKWEFSERFLLPIFEMIYEEVNK